jgi:hypothetical protein
MNRLIASSAITLIVMCGILASGVADAKDKTNRYEVTITNITRGQIISPPIVISHNKDFQLFSLGNPATPELAKLAEGGRTGPLSAYLDRLDSVYDHNNDQNTPDGPIPIMPGASVTIQISTKKSFRHLSAAGMPVNSNDAFFAIRGVEVRSKGDMAVDARAYDAGSEVNNELCAFIPGCEGGGMRDPDGAEGYVYISSGIHDIGDLASAEFDWRNPVATIMFQKVK